MSFYSLLADLIVAVHVAYVGFLLVGLILILVGAWRGWSWTRNRWFRLIHLALIAIVVAESWLDISCPLTSWESDLRHAAGETSYAGSFIGHWMHELLFFDAPTWAFTLCYTLFGVAVLATLLFAPPRWSRR